jgi:hypothetical protein
MYDAPKEISVERRYSGHGAADRGNENAARVGPDHHADDRKRERKDSESGPEPATRLIETPCGAGIALDARREVQKQSERRYTESEGE